jgi:hypothetical protein
MTPIPLGPGGVDKATMVSALDTAEKKREDAIN